MVKQGQGEEVYGYNSYDNVARFNRESHSTDFEFLVSDNIAKTCVRHI